MHLTGGGVKDRTFFQTLDAGALGLGNLSFLKYVPKISMAIRWYKTFICFLIGSALKHPIKARALCWIRHKFSFVNMQIPFNSNSMAGLINGKQTAWARILCLFFFEICPLPGCTSDLITPPWFNNVLVSKFGMVAAKGYVFVLKRGQFENVCLSTRAIFPKYCLKSDAIFG